MEDASGDGVPNLVKFLTDGNPLVHDRTGLPQAFMAHDEGSNEWFFGVEFVRRSAAWGLQLSLEASDDLRNWEEVEAELEAVELLEDGNERVVMRELEPIEGRQHRFYRLAVELINDH